MSDGICQADAREPLELRQCRTSVCTSASISTTGRFNDAIARSRQLLQLFFVVVQGLIELPLAICISARKAARRIWTSDYHGIAVQMLRT